MNGRFAMDMKRALAIAAVAAATLASGMLGLTARAQETQAQVPAVNQTATPVLWRDPGPIGEKDLFWGAGSAERRPEPPFTFVKEDLSGSKPKVRVTDARGRAWNVKFAGELKEKNEVNPEVAANRLIWALGYLAEEDYYVAEGTIQGVRGLQRASSSIRPDGTFRTARFERRDRETSCAATPTGRSPRTRSPVHASSRDC